MVSKTATIFLLVHTTTTLIGYLLIQLYTQATTIDIPTLTLIQFTIIIQLLLNIPIFLTLEALNYCCRLIPVSSRVSFRRHLITTLFLAPLLAQLFGRWMGWLESEYGSVSASAMACWEQTSLRDPAVIQKSRFCREKYGLGRVEAEKGIGGRRGRQMYVEDLARTCIDGLMEMEFAVGGVWEVCWVGGEEEEEDERVEEEGRNSERGYGRRLFEACHARFGIEVQMFWKKGKEMPEVKIKVPDIMGTPFMGQFLELDTETMEFDI